MARAAVVAALLLAVPPAQALLQSVPSSLRGQQQYQRQQQRQLGVGFCPTSCRVGNGERRSQRRRGRSDLAAAAAAPADDSSRWWWSRTRGRNSIFLKSLRGRRESEADLPDSRDGAPSSHGDAVSAGGGRWNKGRRRRAVLLEWCRRRRGLGAGRLSDSSSRSGGPAQALSILKRRAVSLAVGTSIALGLWGPLFAPSSSVAAVAAASKGNVELTLKEVPTVAQKAPSKRRSQQGGRRSKVRVSSVLDQRVAAPSRKGRNRGEAQLRPTRQHQRLQTAAVMPSSHDAKPLLKNVISASDREKLRSLKRVVGKEWDKIVHDFNHHVPGSKRDTLLIMLITALTIPTCQKLKISPIIGFLAVGLAIGPNGLMVVDNVHTMEILGELGIVFFLFEMGLELSMSRLKSMKRDVFGLGLLQYICTALSIAAVGSFAGLDAPALVVIGGGLALSSSAFVLQLLRDKDAMGTRHGRACFGVLLFQDLAVVPLLVAIPLLAGGGTGVAAALGSALFKAVLALGIIAFIGSTLLDRLFFVVSRTKNQEAFMSLILLTVLTMSTITEGLGLSNTLGAFLAGVLLCETKYRYQVEAEVAPLRAMLLGLFFMTVGFSVDMELILSNLPLVGSLVVGLLSLKAGLLTLISLSVGLSLTSAQRTGLLLSQGGEFAFVAFGLGSKFGILEPELCKLLVTTVAMSMGITPYLGEFSNWIAQAIEDKQKFNSFEADGEGKEASEIIARDDFVTVVGYGRIGKMVCDLLDKKFIPYIAFEMNPLKAKKARQKGLPVYYGDARRGEVLHAFNVGKSKALICTISDLKATNTACMVTRREYPDLPMFVRAKDHDHRKRLQGSLNVVAMVPVLPEDSVLVSLPFGGAVLRSLGLDEEEVHVLLEEIRKKVLTTQSEIMEEQDSMMQQLGLGQLGAFERPFDRERRGAPSAQAALIANIKPKPDAAGGGGGAKDEEAAAAAAAAATTAAVAAAVEAASTAAASHRVTEESTTAPRGEGQGVVVGGGTQIKAEAAEAQWREARHQGDVDQ